MRKSIFYVQLLLVTYLHAQIPSPEFSLVKESICQSENLEITNLSVNAEDYQWDFCVGELSDLPEASDHFVASSIRQSFDVEIVNDDGIWYAFPSSRDSDVVNRLTFTEGLRSEPTITPLPNAFGVIDPNGFSLSQDNGIWVGFSVNVNDDRLIRYTFGQDLSMTPTEEELTGIGLYEGNNDVTSVVDSDSVFVFVSVDNVGSIVRLRYPLLNPSNISTDTITMAGYSEVSDFQLIQEEDRWFGLTTSFLDSRVSKLPFGTSLSNSPSISNISGSFPSAAKAELVVDGLDYYGFVQLRGGSLIRLDFGESMSNTPVRVDLGNLGLLPSNSFAYAMGNDGSEWTGYGIGFSDNTLYQIRFEDDCVSDNLTSEEFEPREIRYGSSDRKYITLKAISEEGHVSYYLDSVDVSTNVSPSAMFTLSSSQCISTANTFNSTTEGLTYSWDFNSDGMEDSNLENPEVSFDTLGGVGTYLVRLDVNDGICDNFTEQEITIYPEPPIPSFGISTSGTFCTNNELSFENTTDETGYNGVLTYQWSIDGELVNQRDTVFTFTSPGEKIVTLQSFVPGCESSITSQIVDIGEGSLVDFSFFNNCYNEPIQFISEVSGGVITSYRWDFGDGIGTSAQQDTVYQYAVAGTYTVELEVTNDQGCVSAFQNDITVNDQPLVDFDFSEGTENLPIEFNGMDLTLENDSVVGWNWDFADFGSSSEEDTAFIFPQGTYSVVLSVTTAQGCDYEVSKLVDVKASSCPTISFNFNPSVCMEENLEITNLSVNAESYQWDFCVRELLTSPLSSSHLVDVSIRQSFDIEIINDEGIWYGFPSGRDGDIINRLTFGESLRNVPTITPLPNTFGVIDPNGFSLYQDNGIWVGFSVNVNDDRLIRYTFGEALSMAPTEEELIDIGLYEGNSDVTSVIDSDSVFVFVSVASAGSIVRLRYPLLNPSNISADTIIMTGYSQVSDLQLIQECDSWYGLTTSFGDSRVSKLSFGTSLSNSPSISNVSGSFPSAAKAELVVDGLDYYGFVQLRGGSLVRLDFGTSMSNTPVRIDLGNLGVLPSNSFAFSMGNDGSEWTGYGVGFSDNTLYQIRFEDDCVSDNLTSEEFEPIEISYGSSGRKYITLKAISEEGHVSYYLDSVDVSSDVSPSAMFTISSSQCISTANTFNSTARGLTYSWDFNNDGIEDSNLENPEVLFDTLSGVGTYLVRLDVDDGTCHNLTEQEITIYPEPPAPVVLPSVITQCLSADIEITNNTDETQHFGILTYQWDFNEDGFIDSTDPEPSFSFSEPGIKTISVYTEIPGCNSSTESIEITILDGPTSNFTATTVCDGEAVSFGNISENAASYEWDFTDGITSTSENPDHVFPGAGSYFVELTATDENGCEDIAINEVLVQDIPEVLFDYTIVCNSSSGNLFEDRSTVNNSDIVAWSWSVGGTEVSTDQNPSLSFEEPGIVDIALTVISGNGCESSYSEEVEILQAPIPDFSFSIGCVGEVSSFSDMTSSDGSEIQSWIWDVNGTTYLTENIDHVFNAPGQYDVTLEVGTQNFCSESITQVIEVLQLPELDFLSIGNCENETISVSDMINVFNDPIVSQQWLLGNNPIGNGNEIFISGLDPGTYDLTLQVETENGCVISDTRQLVVNNAPISLFSANKLYGVPDENILFSNESVGASTYVWLQDGAVINESENVSSLSFAQAGDYSISLIAMNDLGCSDTLNQDITIRVPEVDLLITNFDIVEENNIGSVLVEIENQSNLPIDATSIRITLENLFSVTETVNEFIDVGESKTYCPEYSIPLELSEPAYFCVSIESQYAQYADITPLNNEKCLTIEPSIVVEDPFPNPVVNLVRLKLVVPTESFVIVSVISSSGKLELKERQNTSIGLNNIFIDMSDLNTGLYFVLLEIDGNTIQKKLLKI